MAIKMQTIKDERRLAVTQQISEYLQRDAISGLWAEQPTSVVSLDIPRAPCAHVFPPLIQVHGNVNVAWFHVRFGIRMSWRRFDSIVYCARGLSHAKHMTLETLWARVEGRRAFVTESYPPAAYSIWDVWSSVDNVGIRKHVCVQCQACIWWTSRFVRQSTRGSQTEEKVYTKKAQHVCPWNGLFQSQTF